MTDEEKLQEYLRENALKEKNSETPVPEIPRPARSKSNKTPTEWYNAKVWGEFRFIMMAGIFVPAVVLGVMENNEYLVVEQAWTIGGVIIGAVLVATIGIVVYKLFRYSSWMNSKYYKLTGWDEFFENRTKKFWEQRNYTNIRISFNLTPEASDLHREVVKTFTAKMIKKWNKEYQDKDLDWIGSVPKDFQSNGVAIYGDVSQRELLWVFRVLNPKFIPVAKLLGKQLVDVSIRSGGKESTHSMKEEDDDDVHDRHQSWVSRHENN